MRAWLKIAVLVAALLVPAVAHAAVAVDATGSSDTLVNNTTSLTFTNITVGSGANRALVVVLAFGNTGATAPSAISCTWDNGGTNQAMTAVTGASGGRQTTKEVYTAIFGLVAPTSGNKTLACSWTSNQYCYVDAISFTGVNQTGGATSFANGTFATGASAAPAVTVTSAIGDYVVSSVAPYGAITSVTAAQLYKDNSGAQQNGGASYLIGAATVPVAAVTGVDIWSISGVDVVAAGAASGTDNSSLEMLGVSH